MRQKLRPMLDQRERLITLVNTRVELQQRKQGLEERMLAASNMLDRCRKVGHMHANEQGA